MSHLSGGDTLAHVELQFKSRSSSSYLLPINSHCSVDNKLSRLPCTARKQSSEDSNIQPTLQGSESHLCIRNKTRSVPAAALAQTRATASRLLRAIIGRQIGRVHGDDAADALREHALPLALADLLAVVGTRNRLGSPFLLEESSVRGSWGAESLQVIQVIFAPRLTDFLGRSEVSNC